MTAIPIIINSAGRPNINLKIRAIIEKTNPIAINTMIIGSATAPSTSAIIPIINPKIIIANSVNIFIPHFINNSCYIYLDVVNLIIPRFLLK